MQVALEATTWAVSVCEGDIRNFCCFKAEFRHFTLVFKLNLDISRGDIHLRTIEA